MARITKKAVDALRAKAERDTYIWDDEIAGFGVKATKAGNKTYLLQYRYPAGRAGKTRRLTIGRHGALTPDQARALARDAAVAVAAGRDPHAEKRRARETAAEAMTLDQVVADFLAAFEHEVKKGERSAKTLREYRYALQRLPRNLMRRPIREIGTEDVLAWNRELGSGAMADLAMRILSALFRHAIAIGQIERSPMIAAKERGLSPWKQRRRERYLSGKEWSRLGETLGRYEAEMPMAVTAIRLLAVSGMRKSEALNLSWSDIDEERGEIVLKQHKTSGSTGVKRIPITPPIQELLDQARPWREGIGEVAYVFPGRVSGRPLVNLSKPWNRVRQDAGLNDVRLHDLRHSFASEAASDNMSLPMIGSLLGHRQAATTQRYAHLHDDPRRQAAGRVANKVHAALNANSTGGRIVPLKAEPESE